MRGLARVLKPCVWTLALGAAAEAAGAPASFTALGDLPGGAFGNAALGVSADGRVVVGRSVGASGSEAVRWEGGAPTGLGDLPGGTFSSLARAASADGAVVVGRATPASDTEAFRWEAGVMTGLGNLPGGSGHGQANGVSGDGSVVVGFAAGPSGLEAFRWQGGVMQGLGDLPGGGFSSAAVGVSADGTRVAGYGNSGDFEAFAWQGGSLLGLGFLADPGSSPTFQSLAYGISADGAVIVGTSHNRRLVFDPYSGQYVEAEYLEPFRFRDGVLSSLFDGLEPGDPPGQPWTFGVAMPASADGSVIVGYGFGAFIWREVGGMRDLEEWLESDFDLDLAGWTLERATGVSANGRVIVGYGRNPAGAQEAWRVGLPAGSAVPALSRGGLLLAVAAVLVGAVALSRRTQRAV